MANPPRQKGTGGETELLRILAGYGLTFARTAASSPYDLTNARPDVLEVDPLEVLATRPDRGQWLVTMRVSHFADLLSYLRQGSWETHIEVKRYKRFSLHSTFEKKFGG